MHTPQSAPSRAWTLRTVILAAAALVAACAGPKAAEPDAPAPHPQPSAAASGKTATTVRAEAHEEGLTVSTSYCPRGGCDVTFTFSEPMVAPDQLASAPPVPVVFRPSQDGRFHWESETQLVFTPADGSMEWGHQIEVKVSEAISRGGRALAAPFEQTVWVPQLWVGDKVASWPIVRGRPRFMGVMRPVSDPRVGHGPMFLLYDQPVDPARVAAHLRVLDQGGRPIAVTLSRPDSAAPIYDGKLDPKQLVAVKLGRVPDDGEQVEVRYPSWKGTGPPVITSTTVRAATKLELKAVELQNMGDWAPLGERPTPAKVPKGVAPLHATWEIAFTNPVNEADLSKHVTITPKPESLSIDTWAWWDEAKARVTAQLKPGVDYELRVSPSLTDVYGNKLGVAHEEVVRAQDLAPTVTLADASVIVERGRPVLPVRLTNVAATKLKVYRVKGPAEFVAALGKQATVCADYGVPMSDVTTVTPGVDPPLNEVRELEIPLDAALGRARGFLCVELSARDRGSESKGSRSAAGLVQLTDVGLMAKTMPGGLMVWATSLSDTAPRAGATVKVLDRDGKVLAQGRTAADGVASLKLDRATRTGLDGGAAYVVAESAGDVGLAQIGEGHLSKPWQFGIRGAVADAQPMTASLFTERGIYRPGEKVHLKAFVRDPATLAPPRDRVVKLRVQDARGRTLLSRPLNLDQFGGTDIDLQLPEDGVASLGTYTVLLSQGDARASKSFLVEAYRVPTFEVKVDDQDRGWEPGARATAVVGADYLHGGALAAREVRWRVTREPARVSAPGLSGFEFVSRPEGSASAVVAEDVARLDGRGRLPVDFAVEAPIPFGPARYTLEASVADLDRQVYAGRLSKVVHPTDTYVGVAPPKHRVRLAGEALSVPVVAVGTDGRTKKGVRIEAVLERTEHHTVTRAGGDKIQSSDASVVARCRVTSSKRPETCRFVIPEAGSYRVRAWEAGKERRERVEASFSVSAAGGGLSPWPRFDHERVEVVADKARYQPGETARLLVKSPFAKARALVTLERDGVISHRVVTIDGDTPAIEIPVGEEHAPAVYASVVVVRGREHDQKNALGQETGAPAMRLGYATLKVAPVHAKLSVEVAPGRRVVEPGGELELELTLRDGEGRPVKGTAAVAVVDEAVLGLTGFRTPNPLSDLMRPRPLGVRTAESRLELASARRARHAAIFPAGDGGDYEPGGKEESPAEARAPVDVRDTFQSTAIWRPDVRFDAEGRATLRGKLPDNLTSWRVMVMAVGPGVGAGQGEERVTVRKPLMVQPIVPRFLYPGDELSVGAQVFNGTDAAGEATIVAQLDGVTMTGGQGKAARKLEAGRSVAFEVPVKVDGRGEAVLKFQARLGEHTDAVEVRVPILDPGLKRKSVVSHQVAGQDEVAIELPEDRVAGSGEVEVAVSTASLSTLKDSVDYLMRYPHGCIEQTTSGATPLLVLKDLLPEMGVTVDQGKLKEFATAGVKRLLSFQTTSGGLSYWPGEDEPHAFGTAFGLTALIEAKAQGYDVPDAKLARMADYLETTLAKGTITESMPHGGLPDGDTRALFVMTLGRLGRPQPQHIDALWQGKDKLSPFGLALLAVAAGESNSRKALVEPILADVRVAAKQAQQEAWYEGERGQGYSMGSPLRTHAGALLAFAGRKPTAEMSKKLLTGLLNRAQNGQWGNTQENVFGMLAVATLARSAPTGKAPEMRLSVAGRPIDPARMEATAASLRRLRLSAADVGLGAEGRGRAVVQLDNRATAPLYLTVRTTWEAKLEGENLKAKASGFTVDRRYETVDGKPLGGVVPLGSLVKVRLTVDAASQVNYVAIDDLLPAGLEPLNMKLATTEKVALGEPTEAQQRGLAKLSYQEIRDDRVSFYVDDMPKGRYELVYLARATSAGRFLRPPAQAEAMYAPEISGRTAVDRVEVR